MRRSAHAVPRVLVTGFGPFPDMPANPTTRLVEALAASPPPGVSAMVLATHWSICDRVAAEAARHDAIILFGVAGSARRIRYERVCLPVASSRPDAAGVTALAAPSRSRRSAMNLAAVAARARRAGYPVALSHSAGTYICNASYGAALSANPMAMFVHVPQSVARGPLGDEGLQRHARWLIAEVSALLRPLARRIRRDQLEAARGW